jgi:hypothetical protein
MRWIQISDDYDDTLLFGVPGYHSPKADPPYELLDALVQSGHVDTQRDAREWVANAEVFTHKGEDRTTWTYITDGAVDIELLDW